MRNPWLDIPLADYEAHMALPTVGQAQLIADELGTLVRAHSPTAVAVIGCAGGNGFDRVARTGVRRVIGVDLNPGYIEQARTRYQGLIPGLELHVADIQGSDALFAPVDLIYVALVLEYVDVARTMTVLKRHCSPNGVLAVLSQLPHEAMSDISPSPYASLQVLAPAMQLIAHDELQRHAGRAGFALERSRIATACGGKRFRIDEFSQT